MNPPFERGEDIKHIQHAFDLLNPEGRLLSVACGNTGIKLDRWVADHGGTVEPLPSGTFAVSERPTQVSACLFTLDK
jgi:16S rRNA G1207 methylase RsmC